MISTGWPINPIMKTKRFLKRSRISVPARELYEWHARQGALRRLTPPWETVDRVVQAPLSDGSTSSFRIKAGPFGFSWIAEHSNCVTGNEFTDIQISGPFARWKHIHRFIPEGDRSCLLEDDVEYRLKLHPVSDPLIGRHIARRLDRMFSYRHAVTARDLGRAVRGKPLRIALTGASGLIGGSLVPLLTTGGHTVTVLSRGRSTPGGAAWDPSSGRIDYSFAETDAVIHLAGEPIGTWPWTAGKKRAIMNSRIDGTRLLAEKLAGMRNPPASLLCASAIGYYGDRGESLMTEADGPGGDFISEVCARWENAAAPAVERGIRVVFLRIGVVLDPRGGALRGMLLPARLGLAGPIGPGLQFVSWISVEDLIRAIEHILVRDDIRGPINLVAPSPVRNGEFAKILGSVLGRPSPLRVPGAAVRLALGRMGQELILSSTRVSSRTLIDTGFTFLHGRLDRALKYLLGKRDDE